MSGFRIAMVSVTPLLADLIRHGLGSRISGMTFTELSDLQDAYTRLRQIGANVVIIGPSVRKADVTVIQEIVPRAQVLAVSANLSQFVDLRTGEPAPFTPDTLADCLRR